MHTTFNNITSKVYFFLHEMFGLQSYMSLLNSLNAELNPICAYFENTSQLERQAQQKNLDSNKTLRIEYLNISVDFGLL
jgi:hypothetical protein